MSNSSDRKSMGLHIGGFWCWLVRGKVFQVSIPAGKPLPPGSVSQQW